MRQLPPTRYDGGELLWGVKTYVMAILNLTPDSFSGDGIAGEDRSIVDRALGAEAGGVDILDIGGESTRPGHTPVDPDEQIRRVIPAIGEIAKRLTIPISIDTSSAMVAQAALDAGVKFVNDVRGLTGDPDLAGLVAERGCPVVIMHDVEPDPYGDLVASVIRELSRRIDRALAAGIAWERIIIDPGFGFGKDWRQNLELMRRLAEFQCLDRPILSGTSRKGTIGKVLDLPVEDRVEGTAATVSLAIAAGADIVRVHDVLEMSRVVKMSDAIVRPNFDLDEA